MDFRGGECVWPSSRRCGSVNKPELERCTHDRRRSCATAGPYRCECKELNTAGTRCASTSRNTCSRISTCGGTVQAVLLQTRCVFEPVNFRANCWRSLRTAWSFTVCLLSGTGVETETVNENVSETTRLPGPLSGNQCRFRVAKRSRNCWPRRFCQTPH